MAVSTFAASMAYYDTPYGWTSGLASQGNGSEWGAGTARHGILYFKGLAALKGKTIGAVSLKFTLSGGYSSGKALRIYTSKLSGLVISGKTGASYLGTKLGDVSGLSNTAYTKEVTAILAKTVQAGAVNDTFVLYSASTLDYAKVSSVSLVVTWTEPYLKSTISAAPSTVTLGVASGTISLVKGAGAADGSNTHSLSYVLGGTTTVVATKSAGTSFAFTPPLTLAAKEIPGTTTTLKGKILCKTYAPNGNLVGEDVRTLTFVVPDNANTKPSCTVSRAASVNPFTGVSVNFVQGYSKLSVQVSPTAQYGATVSSVTANLNGVSTVVKAGGGIVQLAPLSVAGNTTLTLRVVDSRGFVGTVTTPVLCAVQAYAAPTVQLTKSTRSEDGRSLTVQFAKTGAFFTDQGNSYTVKLYYRSKTGTAYTGVTLAAGALAHTLTGLSPSESYVFYLEHADKIAKGISASGELSAVNGMPFSFAKDAFAVGGSAAAQPGKFTSYLPVYLRRGFYHVPLLSETDLDKITTTGFYHCRSTVTARTLLHCPTAIAFGMQVTEHAGICQEVTEYTTTGARKFFRNFYGDIWGAWVVMAQGEMLSGTINAKPTAINTTESMVVPYGRTFLSVPHVVVTPRIGDANLAKVSVGVLTTTGFTLYFEKSTLATFAVEWIAVAG